MYYGYTNIHEFVLYYIDNVSINFGSGSVSVFDEVKIDHSVLTIFDDLFTFTVYFQTILVAKEVIIQLANISEDYLIIVLYCLT